MITLTRKREQKFDLGAWAACSVLLDYPSEQLIANLPNIKKLVGDHSGANELINFLQETDLQIVQQQYVQTFDLARKCSLYLTYYAYGDTRNRGQALLHFKQIYRNSGGQWNEETGELPDHLCALLTFGVTVDAEAAYQLMLDHRAGLEMLNIALQTWRNEDDTVGSPWLGAITMLCDTLPELAGEGVEALRRLIEQGPPAEEVGLGGYGVDPAISMASPVLISGSSIQVGAPR